MRKVPALLFLLAACTATPPPSDRPADLAAGPYGMTVAEEARILALEDRREYDPAVVATFVNHPNALHRARIALALGRIGPHTFVDGNGDGEQTSDERQAGVAELLTLAQDPDRRVRETVAFALGEIGDLAATETLFTMSSDADGSVAAEAVEALSKLGTNPRFSADDTSRYIWMTDERWPEGIRARAIRYLFRLERESAAAAAMRALASPSPAVRQEGAYSLSRKPLPAAARELALLLTDPNVLTRAYSAAALGKIGDVSAAPALMNALGDVHPWVRTNAAVALTRLLEKDASLARDEDLPRVFAAMEDPDPGVRASTIDLLGFYAKKNETARERLLRVLRDGTAAEREMATREVLKHLGGEAFTVSPYPRTPWAIVRLMEAQAGTRAWPPFQTHESAMVRAAELQSLPDAAVNAEAERLRNAIKDPDVMVRAAAIDRYKQVTSDPAELWVKTLEEAEQRERTAELNDARIAAIRALAEFDRPEREPFLRSLLKDADPVVRRIAAELIDEKLGARRQQYTPLPVNRTAAEYEEIVRWSREPHTATIHMTRGKIEIALLTHDAPMTAWNFAQLAQKKFYDNTTFMRVVPNFVIQGGDPRNDQNGGPGYAIRDEINLQKYTRGAVGMALSGPDTGGSQFFITHSPQPHLDGGYTIFGRVYDGMTSTVDQTERGDRVLTITIDEQPPAAAAEKVGSVPNVSLPLVVGSVTRERLQNVLPAYVERSAAYEPDVTVLEMMKSYVQAGDRVEVFMGTWCDDSLREVPKFLRIADELKSQYGVELPTKFVAVARDKRSPAPLVEGKSLEKVATFIYYRDDRELGRIVERPGGLFEDDLLAIVASER